MTNINNVLAKSEKVKNEAHELRIMLGDLRLEIDALNYDEIRARIVARAEALAELKKQSTATPENVLELARIHKLMDAISDMEGLTPPQTKAELAALEMEKFKKIGGVLSGEDNERKDSTKTDP